MMDKLTASNTFVPTVRFEGFNGAWLEKTLYELGELKNGMNFSKEAMGHGHPFVNLQDIFGKNVVSNNVLGLAVSSENQRKDYSLKEGDVLFVRSSVKPSGVGEAAVVISSLKDTTYSGFIIRFRPKQKMAVNFSRFVYSTANIRKQIIAGATSSANTNINQELLQLIELKIPKFVEQTKIGQYFQQLDTLIAQHEQKHDKLLNLKKSLLEKMFPKQGTDEPAIRFKGFSGAWEKNIFGDVITFVNGRAYSQDELLNSGKYPVLRVGNFYTNSSWYYSNLELGEKYYADDGDLLYTWSASFGPHVWKGEKVIYHYHIWKLLLSRRLERSFLLHVLNKDRDNILSGSNGSTMIHITKEGMEKKSTLIPEKKEQGKLGMILNKLDTLTTQHQTQLKKLNNIKQACLAKLFV